MKRSDEMFDILKKDPSKVHEMKNSSDSDKRIAADRVLSEIATYEARSAKILAWIAIVLAVLSLLAQLYANLESKKKSSEKEMPQKSQLPSNLSFPLAN